MTDNPIVRVPCRLSRITTLLIIAAAVAAAVSYYFKGVLPLAKDILPQLDREPVQETTHEERFVFSYAEKRYLVEPVAKYSLYGLVVSHNDISAFWDIYHDKTSVDIKDLCVIWGHNTVDNNFRQLKYRSEPWSCLCSTNSIEVFRNFRQDQMSNNHLLAGDESVREQIRNAHVGDQIYFQGLLVNYAPEDKPDLLRKTSTVRTDTGNGACEVVFVTDFRILKPHNARWHALYIFAKRVLLLLLVLKLVLFVIVP